MAKANFILSGGTKVDIEGTPEEIQKLLSFYESMRRTPTAPSPSPEKASPTRQKRDGAGAKVRVRGLIGDDFFQTPRSLKAIQDKLAEDGHIYPQSGLSARLIELTKARELRRFKDKDVWVYVNR